MIKFYNRKTKNYEIEDVLGEKAIKWTYESPIGKSLLSLIIKRKLFSKLYGAFCDTSFSKGKIKSFIKDFDLDTTMLVKDLSNFKNFNDFFIRELKSEARPINYNEDILISPGDGRLTVFDKISINDMVQVKNLTYSLSELLGDDKLAKEYENGSCFILRLCPTDYHRFHFIDSGYCGENTLIPGNYYSVNPVALERIPKLYCQNKREWSIFHSDNFGDIIHIEVGATCVGSIIQSYIPNNQVSKGDE